MTTQDKINAIIKKRYNNYEHPNWASLKKLHQIGRALRGDEAFLELLEKQERDHPFKPYEIPKEILDEIRNDEENAKTTNEQSEEEKI